MIVKLTESDVLAAFDDRREGAALFKKLDVADGKVDGIYKPAAAAKLAKSRVSAGGMDALAGVREECQGLQQALENAEKLKLRSAPRFRAAVEVAEAAVSEAAQGLKVKLPARTVSYTGRWQLTQFRDSVTKPLIALLKGVQENTRPYARENPDQTAKVVTDYETIDLKPLYEQWIAERDARAVPLQRQSYAIRDKNYAEYQRLNDQAMRIMNEAEARIFGSQGFKLSDYSYQYGATNKVTREVSRTELPPKTIYDESVPAAQQILAKAERDIEYREELCGLLADSARLALLLDHDRWHRYDLSKPQQQLATDLHDLLGKANIYTGCARDAVEAIKLSALNCRTMGRTVKAKEATRAAKSTKGAHDAAAHHNVVAKEPATEKPTAKKPEAKPTAKKPEAKPTAKKPEAKPVPSAPDQFSRPSTPPTRLREMNYEEAENYRNNWNRMFNSGDDRVDTAWPTSYPKIAEPIPEFRPMNYDERDAYSQEWNRRFNMGDDRVDSAWPTEYPMVRNW